MRWPIAFIVLLIAIAAAGVVSRRTDTRRAAPADAPVRMSVRTTVTVDPDGVARMTSASRFTDPPALVALLHDLGTSRRAWLTGLFEQTVRESLAEQPWQAGETSVRFDLSDPQAFRADSNVVLYRYAWVESADEELWYSPGVVTRQDGLVGLVRMLRTFGHPVTALHVDSSGRAYWPAHAVVTETFPTPGLYESASGAVRMTYRLRVHTDPESARPIVDSDFTLDVDGGNLRAEELDGAFATLMRRTGVDPSSRLVYIKYKYPPRAATAFSPTPREYRDAPTRRASLAFLMTAFAGIGALYTYLRREARR